jgi:hypothetical protein
VRKKAGGVFSPGNRARTRQPTPRRNDRSVQFPAKWIAAVAQFDSLTKH